MNKQQWEDLARFAGVEIKWFAGSECPWRLEPTQEPDFKWKIVWRPVCDWNDFGPLWVKLDALDIAAYRCHPQELAAFIEALRKQDIPSFMHAGCELGAAIGKAMREAEGKV